MEKMTMKAYAVKHKLSLFNVVKLVKSGKVKSETVTEEGKETIYIIVDENNMTIAKEKEYEAQKDEDNELETRVTQLEAEVRALRREIEALKKARL
ncbi:hypothetical protein YH65_04175 [Sulfurovum lithotrophicum]|uniref:Uncharacterized protein n=1 Tax=Sulfurovum lithotrophicum TaxID=206403 RepID=A0A7U4RQE7_9BACT|nr:hypothetical protein [Sulfurovum lithotrophicum]AKF24671.1 hypothetical protein YH65_04175 [Sulfurovum lithotrophicum]